MLISFYFCIILHLHLMHCTIVLMAHVCSYALDHTEPKLEEPTKQAQVKEFSNLALDQGNPWCI
jgi:hypothetical protein